LPSSIDSGTPPATAVSGAAAETTRTVMAPTPRLFLRNWFAPAGGTYVSVMIFSHPDGPPRGGSRPPDAVTRSGRRFPLKVACGSLFEPLF
jgi:hypothetical protein